MSKTEESLLSPDDNNDSVIPFLSQDIHTGTVQAEISYSRVMASKVFYLLTENTKGSRPVFFRKN